MGLHVFPIPIPPPTSLSTCSLQVFPVRQVRVLVSCIQPGLVHLLLFWGVLPRWLRVRESACQCKRSRRCGFDFWFGKIPWKIKRQPTLVFLPGKLHGQRNLAGYGPWEHKKLDTTEYSRIIFFRVFSHRSLCRVLRRVSCTIQWVLISYLLYIQWCAYVNPNFPAYPFPLLPGNHKLAFYICNSTSSVFVFCFKELFFPHAGHYRVLSRDPCAIQEVSVNYQFYIQQCIYVRPNFTIYL